MFIRIRFRPRGSARSLIRPGCGPGPRPTAERRRREAGRVPAGGTRRVAQHVGGGSFLSASDRRLHSGLGDATRVDRVEVRWPSGRAILLTLISGA
jgi:ASPIC and UnbV